MASVSEAPAAARRGGWERPVISERVTHAATSTGRAGTASVNAARAGTESTAPSEATTAPKERPRHLFAHSPESSQFINSPPPVPVPHTLFDMLHLTYRVA
ncbi:UNVERIFIED_CONTAM: hypothetical protein K2H54_070281 [Gekko kuhli]